MKVFISWSGSHSRMIADALRKWLPDVIQSVEPWMSDVDIDAGTRWTREIEQELSETNFGIVCLTKENQKAPWLLFEAGALAKTISNTFVCPYLIDLTPSDIDRGPLTQFQAKRANEKETWELVQTMNKAMHPNGLADDKLRRTFERWWPDLKKVLDTPVSKPTLPVRARPVEDITQEILELVRSLTRTTPLESDLTMISLDIAQLKSILTSLYTQSRLETETPDKHASTARLAWRDAKQVEFTVIFPGEKQSTSEQIVVSGQETIFDILSEIWRLLQRPSSAFTPPPYTYLWDWILVREEDSRPLLIRGVSEIIPAHVLFQHGDTWKVVPLDEPVLHQAERFKLVRGASMRW